MTRILLIDDDPAVCDSTAAILRAHGHSVTSATDGDRALKQLSTESFDLVITDIMMPIMDGIEVIRELRMRQPNLKIIAMSGGGRGAQFAYLHAAGKLGADAILEKPFHEDHLLWHVERLMRAPM